MKNNLLLARKFVIGVENENTGRVLQYTVVAHSSDDAIQLAFALDGGWKGEDASEMLALAKCHCSVIEHSPLPDGALRIKRSLAGFQYATNHPVRAAESLPKTMEGELAEALRRLIATCPHEKEGAPRAIAALEARELIAKFDAKMEGAK